MSSRGTLLLFVDLTNDCSEPLTLVPVVDRTPADNLVFAGTNNPILKQLLVNYILREYEEDSIIDENHLMMEYNRLRDSNQLDMIFMCEELINREQNN